MIFDKILGRKKSKPTGEKLSYEAAREALADGEKDTMSALAERDDTRPEMLYYLAEQGEADVRAKVAANNATPLAANELLADDEAEDVRAELARKIARLLPDMGDGERNVVHERTLELLDKLAQDQLPKVRAIVAEEIKRSPNVPKHIVDRLARDMDTIVCVPILAYSPLLSDEDLTEIIAAGTVQDALSAIAGRPGLSEDVADAVVATFDVPAVAALLTNESAKIREDTLDAILDGADQVQAWHEPLALRSSLSIRAMKRIAGFVASSLVAAMVENQVLEDEAAEDILDNARKRIHSEQIGDDEEAAITAEAEALYLGGGIDDDFILDAIRKNKRLLIIHCLAKCAEVPVDAAKDVMLTKSGRTVTALAWKAGLSMRTAYALQKSVALVPPLQLLHAENGVDFPIEPKELAWQLEAFLDA